MKNFKEYNDNGLLYFHAIVLEGLEWTMNRE